MSLMFRTTALMLLLLSRAPAYAAFPVGTSSDGSRSTGQNQVCAQTFRHNLSGLYSIPTTHNKPSQPYDDFDVLYSKAHQAQAELEAICKEASLLTSTQTQFAGVKSADRARQKIKLELNGEVGRITDLARATIVAEDISSLMQAYEVLGKEAHIVKVKNRFKQPAPSGYRDLNVLVRLPKTQLIAEVQLHLKAVSEVKNGAEHELYEELQHIERSALAQERDLTEVEVARVKSIRRLSHELYQQAWQPYITTHLSAA